MVPKNPGWGSPVWALDSGPLNYPPWRPMHHQISRFAPYELFAINSVLLVRPPCGGAPCFKNTSRATTTDPDDK